MFKFFIPIIIACSLFWAPTYASELVSDITTTKKAIVNKVVSEINREIFGTGVIRPVQILEVKIIEGNETGKVIDIESDYNHFLPGDKVYVSHNIRGEDGVESYTISDSYRIPTLLLLTIMFVFLVIYIGGKPGTRGLLSLVGSIVLIIFVLLPSISAGYSPVYVSIIVSSFIIILGSYITHGFNKTTSSAVIGMIVTVICTGILAYFVIGYAKLTGFTTDETVYLNFSSKGVIDIPGLLLGGMLIGLLGVLYDIAIGQAIAVEELWNIAPHVSRLTIYKRASRIGREHIGALVNTLAIAYVGASLPLLLLFQSASTHMVEIINREIFATEIIRILIGSIGLVIAVPITTFITVWILVMKSNSITKELVEKEEEILNSHNHHHSH